MRGIKGRMIEKAAGKISRELVNRMVKAVDDKKSWVWPLVLGMALLNDFLDFLAIGSVPMLGDLIDILTGLVLFMFLFDIGGMIRLKVKIAIFIASFFELIPFVDLVPIWTICILWAWYIVRKKGNAAENGLRKLKKGKIDKKAIAEFN
jgi:hypothetical protein